MLLVFLFYELREQMYDELEHHTFSVLIFSLTFASCLSPLLFLTKVENVAVWRTSPEDLHTASHLASCALASYTALFVTMNVPWD